MDNKYINLASELISKQKFNEAKKIIENEQFEDNTEALKLLGLCCMNLNDKNRAIDFFEKVVQITPEDATSWYYLGVLNDNAEIYNKAEEAYLKVIDLRDEFINAYKNLTILYLKNKEPEKAEPYVKKIIELDPLDYQAYYMLGTIAFSHKDFNTAIENYEKSLGLNETPNVALLNSLGAAYFATNKLDKAQEILNQSVKIEEENPISNYHLGNIAQIKKDFENAFKHFRIAYNREPSALHLTSLAYSALKAEKYEDAISLYKTLCIIQPEKQNFQYNLACAYIATENYNEAIQILKKLVMLNPKAITMAEKLAEVYCIINQYEDAKIIYELIIKKGNVAAETYYNYAIICMKTKDTDKAEKILKKVILLEPNFAKAHKDLGILYLSQRLFDYAQDEFEQALKIAPEDPTIIFEFANFLYATSDYHGAKKLYEKASLNCPDNGEIAFYSGLNYLALNEIEKAKSMFEISLKLAPNDINTYHLARINYFLHNFDEAYQLLNKIENKDIDIKNLLALTLYELDKTEDAIRIYKEILEKFHENINIMLSLAKCYIKINNKEEALNAINITLSKFPEHEEALKLLKEAEAL